MCNTRYNIPLFHLFNRASGTQLGALSQCPTAQLVQLKTIAIDADAYGPIADWTASEVGELNFILGKF